MSWDLRRPTRENLLFDLAVCLGVLLGLMLHSCVLERGLP